MPLTRRRHSAVRDADPPAAWSPEKGTGFLDETNEGTSSRASPRSTYGLSHRSTRHLTPDAIFVGIEDRHRDRRAADVVCVHIPAPEHKICEFPGPRRWHVQLLP